MNPTSLPHPPRLVELWRGAPSALVQPDAMTYGHFSERQSGRLACLRGRQDDSVPAGAGLLLRPLHADSAIPLLPADEAGAEPAVARGVAVAQIFHTASGRLDACARAAENWFSRYQGYGVVELAVLANAVQARSGCLVWLGLLQDEAALAALRPRMNTAAVGLAADGLLGAAPELLVLDPRPGSRLRWIAAVPTPARLDALQLGMD